MKMVKQKGFLSLLENIKREVHVFKLYGKRLVVRRGFKNSCFHSSYFVLLLNISNCLLDNYLPIIIYMEIDSGLQVIYWFTNSIFRCKSTLFWFLFYFFHLHLLVVQNKVIQFVP